MQCNACCVMQSQPNNFQIDIDKNLFPIHSAWFEEVCWDQMKPLSHEVCCARAQHLYGTKQYAEAIRFIHSGLMSDPKEALSYLPLVQQASGSFHAWQDAVAPESGSGTWMVFEQYTLLARLHRCGMHHDPYQNHAASHVFACRVDRHLLVPPVSPQRGRHQVAVLVLHFVQMAFLKSRTWHCRYSRGNLPVHHINQELWMRLTQLAHYFQAQAVVDSTDSASAIVTDSFSVSLHNAIDIMCSKYSRVGSATME